MVWSFQVWLKNGIVCVGIVSIREIILNAAPNAKLPNTAPRIVKSLIGKFTKKCTVFKLKLTLKTRWTIGHALPLRCMKLIKKEF